MDDWLDPLRTLRITDLVDLAIVAILLWIGIAWLRATRARLALIGLLILGGVYLLARELDLQLTASILQAFVATSVIVVVVVFQDDIRRLFEQIGTLGTRRRPLLTVADAVDTLVRALSKLAEAHRGALVVIPGREPLEHDLQGGVPLDARISEPLLLSLFDPHSPGHDGAVVLVGDRAVLFAVHLPLSTDLAQLGQRGTRHAAALGLAERTDALCLVVSEERGTLSVALDGRLRTLARPELAGLELRRFLARLAPPSVSAGPRWLRVLRRWREAAAALVVASVLWLLAVPGSGVVEIEQSAPIHILDLPPGYTLDKVDPPDVIVTLRGRRRDLLFLEREGIEVRLSAALAELGRRTFTIDADQVSGAGRAEVVSVAPDSVRISLTKHSSRDG